MKTPGFEVVTLKSGVYTVKDLSTQEIFHPGIGPMEEARILYVEQQRIRERADASERFVIWDVGLGAAANAIAALDALTDCSGQVEIHSFDIAEEPTRFALENAEALVYPASYRKNLEELLTKGSTLVAGKIRWVYHLGDFRKTMYDAPSPHSVFYDPYSSVSNRELWTLDHLREMKSLLRPDCTLSNYSASNSVRTTWLLAGYFVGVGVGVWKKTETLYVSTQIEGITKPLDAAWLAKTLRSQSSAPIRAMLHEPATISSADHESLLRHPQFL